MVYNYFQHLDQFSFRLEQTLNLPWYHDWGIEDPYEQITNWLIGHYLMTTTNSSVATFC